MGVRAWKFYCNDCGSAFWEKFEWIEIDDIKSELDEISCTYCESTLWSLGKNSEFSGSQNEYSTHAEVRCKKCREKDFVRVGGYTKSQLIERDFVVLPCECDDPEYILTDRATSL